MNRNRKLLRVVAFVLMSIGIVLVSLGLFGCGPGGKVILSIDGSASVMSTGHQEAAR